MQQTRRYGGPATIVQGGRSAEVYVTYEVVQRGGLTHWRGEYSDAAVEDEPLEGNAELILPDGSTAAIVITNAWQGTGSGWFSGRGQPPPS
jgi:hypothetical protein